MNRNESFPTASVSSLQIGIAWASLELSTDDAEEIQVLVSGNEEDVDDLRIEAADGRLVIEQPAYGLTTHITMVRWMQIVVRVPRRWMGAVEATTVAGSLRARGLTGSDIVLATVSGDLRTSDISAIELRTRTATGALTVISAGAERFTGRTVSGALRVENGDFRAMRLSSASGGLFLDLDAPFDTLDASTVAGDVTLQAPIAAAVINHRTVTGRLRTGGVSITDEGPAVSVNTVTGDLTVTRKEP